MAYEISKLQAKDFDEAIEFINMCFSNPNQTVIFPEILPALYQPTDKLMGYNHVIRIDGVIRAFVGIYPGDLTVGGSMLKVARIGAVSTHPDYREQGLMKELMNYCLEIVKKEGYDIGFLSGRRNRYQFYEFEKCGNRLMYTITKSNIKHSSIDSINFEIKEIIEDDKKLIKYFKSLHDKQFIHFSRAEEDFFKIVHHWKNSLYGIYQNNKPVGYFITNKNNDHISEIYTENIDTTLCAVHLFVKNNLNDKITMVVNPLQLELAHELENLYEIVDVNDVRNWRVFNWENVLTTLLKAKNDYITLQSGIVTLGIKDYGNINITVDNGNIMVKKVKEEAVFTIDNTVAARLFFGPLIPSMVINLPKEALVLNNWCPLPLFLSMQDFA